MKKVIIGADVSKKKFDVSVIIAPSGEEKPVVTYVGQFENSKGGCSKMVKSIGKLAKGIDQKEWLVCVETTGGYIRLICDTIHEKWICIWREKALQIKWSKGIVRQEDDKTGSGVIAEYAMRH